ncbi:MAG: hypothetical protein NC305_18065 [Lachnospiraceae bacterium]|nr:hypothetical protein [Muribaculaceae bacterium]MCM1412427.1 hypothetical protein [Lachnospiraceae bacterium]
MEFRLKYIFNFEFILVFFMLIASILFLMWVADRINDLIKNFRSFVNYVAIALMIIVIYQSFKCFRQETANYPRFDAAYLLDVTACFTIMDAGIWLIYKFLQAYAKRNMYKQSDTDSPKKLKKNIESLLDQQHHAQNAEMAKLYATLQISALSLKKQEKILRSNFVKNIVISILFFILGLMIPKILMFILSKN